MNKETKIALEDSIAHWERMVEYAGDPQYAGETPIASNCALCVRFSRFGPLCEREDNLGGEPEVCPVRRRTGDRDCLGSPYSEAYWAFVAWREAAEAEAEAEAEGGAVGPDYLAATDAAYARTDAAAARWREAAAKEIEFLKSLREE